MEKFDRSGVWWLPEDGRSQAAGGRLKFDDSRAQAVRALAARGVASARYPFLTQDTQGI
jgi:hypothetical protein